MNFVALDVETANPDLASICQIGIVRYQNGLLLDSWAMLVDPQDEFAPFNTAIHGLDAGAVAGSPTFSELSDWLVEKLSGTIAVTHTAFDRSAVRSACQKAKIEIPAPIWLDSARVARRAWAQFKKRGYGLANVAKELGINFRHHDALEDARAAAEILLCAIEQTGHSVEEWVELTRPQRTSRSMSVNRQAVRDGVLSGEVAVFTGTLSILRTEAADLAAAAGCKVTNSVSRSTTLLIVGDQDIRRLSGHQKSSKHRKAEALIGQGYPLRILQESDFMSLISLTDQET